MYHCLVLTSVITLTIVTETAGTAMKHGAVQNQVDDPEKRAQHDRKEDDHHRRRVDFFPRRPRDALQFVADLGEKRAAAIPPAADVFPRLTDFSCHHVRCHCPPSLPGFGSQPSRGSASPARLPSRSSPAMPASEVWQARRVSNPQPPVLETGALPIELLAYSSAAVKRRRWLALGTCFRLTKSAELLRFLMPRVLPAVPAVLAELEALGRLLPVLRRAVVPALALGARQRNDVSHRSAYSHESP